MTEALTSDASTTWAEPYLFPEREAASYLGLSGNTLRMARHTGRLCGTTPPRWVKLGRSIRYRRNDLVAWAERVAVEPGRGNRHG